MLQWELQRGEGLSTRDFPVEGVQREMRVAVGEGCVGESCSLGVELDGEGKGRMVCCAKEVL